MPIFEYKCGKCGHKFEYLASNSSDNPDECPKCGQKKPVKQMSVFSTSPENNTAGSSNSCPTGTCPLS